jgi:[glutamine synthetase] adenylyltransferase / [glutamine synthetase]-adenylyl-L-tyrosine phosphorylase
VLVFDEKVEALARELPDGRGAILFLQRLAKGHPRLFGKLLQERGLLSDTLALAAWSPLLATTLEQNPEYITWLNRERLNSRVRTPDELKESLARFALTHSSLNPQILLARFRRRELLRIYLHDVRRTHTLVETTEELSNLADAILDYALSLARQDLDNKYGSPLRADERERVAPAEFCVIALGKLGSHELNYSSDIDLVFLYSDDGKTSGAGGGGDVTNREYFVKLAEKVTRLVGQQVGEGAAYRVDLRLRPFGRDGALASSLNEAVRYYRETAQAWELQALIRARAAAGSSALYARFAATVRRQVFRAEVSAKEALANVRLAKEKIDRHLEKRARGFNVKLGRGGIREIEFIAQALQLAHGGRDAWLRAPHTLIILGRLADRNLISEQERTELSDAYVFLRMLEHRLQMEHGLQTHIVPQDGEHRALVARRMNLAAEAIAEFDLALKRHTENVRRAYDRLFLEAEAPSTASLVAAEGEIRDERAAAQSLLRTRPPVDADTAAAYAAASVLASHLRDPVGRNADKVQSLAHLLRDAALDSLNAHRALMLTARIASSLDKFDRPIEIRAEDLGQLVRLCGASELFGEMVAGNPALIPSLPRGDVRPTLDYRAVLRASIDREKTFAAELSSLRRAWSMLLLGIGARDAAGDISVVEANRLQTELAVASITVAYLIARRELSRRFGSLDVGPRLAILGLGRLGTGGVDYRSDLDIIIVYDSRVPSPVSSLTQDEAYARLGELMIAALSSITREGHLYRVDLRLRPHGNDGPLASASQAFVDYLKQTAAPWEWLAYVKLRAVAGDLEFGRTLETRARQEIHEAAHRIDRDELRSETCRVRDRLEREKAKGGRHGGIDIKYGAGGMLDVYFASRYLQLRDNIPDEGEDRSTGATLERLHSIGSLSSENYDSLSRGYGLLRAVDHHLRLVVGRSTRLPAPDQPAMRDIAIKLQYATASALIKAVGESTASIRTAFERIVK